MKQKRISKYKHERNVKHEAAKKIQIVFHKQQQRIVRKQIRDTNLQRKAATKIIRIFKVLKAIL